MKKLFLAFITLIIFSCTGSNSGSNEENKKEDFARKAWIQAQDFVKQELNSPSSADFPFSDYSYTDPTSDNTIIIKSYVDAQNSFGATIRKDFYIKLKFNGGDWADINNWTMLDIEFQ